MGCYALFTGTAIFIGLLYVSVLQPGIIDGAPAGERLNLTLDSAEVENTLNNLQTSEGVNIGALVLRLIPTNLVASMEAGDMLPLIFFNTRFAMGAVITRDAESALTDPSSLICVEPSR
jgi:Na+/H+-dicarboxylate symporter